MMTTSQDLGAEVQDRETEVPPHEDVLDVTVGLQRLRVSVRGEGPPLLLINGIGGNIGMWEPFRSQLVGRTTIAFDAPGTGDSPASLGFPSMKVLAWLVDALLARLGLDRVDVLGWSFGGIVAQELALLRPQRVRRLVLVATTCGLGGAVGHPAALLELSNPWRYVSATRLEAVAPWLFGGTIGRRPALLNEHKAARTARPPSFYGYAWELAAVAGWSSLPWLHRVRNATLVLVGDDDPIIPIANGRLLASRLPRGRLEVVPESGHLLLLEHPQEIADTVSRFLAGDDGEDGEPIGPRQARYEVNGSRRADARPATAGVSRRR